MRMSISQSYSPHRPTLLVLDHTTLLPFQILLAGSPTHTMDLPRGLRNRSRGYPALDLPLR